MTEFKVGDKVYVKIHKSDYLTVVYEGVATILSNNGNCSYFVDKSTYTVYPAWGDIIRPLTKLEKALT